MADWSRETPWRQGHVLSDETVKKTGIADGAPGTIVVVISHDCDLAALPDKEPDAELIVGRLVEKADGNYTHAKTPRVLHLEFTTHDGSKFVELTSTNKTRLKKVVLADEVPRTEFELRPGDQSILQRWLAARYRRAAFPDEFEKRLKDSGAADRLTKILKPAGQHICAIFFDVDDGADVQRNDPEDPHTLSIVLLYTNQPNARESETVALDLKGKIESVFQDLFFKKNNRWTGIELVDCSVMSDEALTYAQSVILKQWRLEHLSLRDEEQQPMMDQ
jgi:hypothetical protein